MTTETTTDLTTYEAATAEATKHLDDARTSLMLATAAAKQGVRPRKAELIGAMAAMVELVNRDLSL